MADDGLISQEPPLSPAAMPAVAAWAGVDVEHVDSGGRLSGSAGAVDLRGLEATATTIESADEGILE